MKRVAELTVEERDALSRRLAVAQRHVPFAGDVIRLVDDLTVAVRLLEDAALFGSLGQEAGEFLARYREVPSG